jgi:hypothetical protein
MLYAATGDRSSLFLSGYYPIESVSRSRSVFLTLIALKVTSAAFSLPCSSWVPNHQGWTNKKSNVQTNSLIYVSWLPVITPNVQRPLGCVRFGNEMEWYRGCVSTWLAERKWFGFAWEKPCEIGDRFPVQVQRPARGWTVLIHCSVSGLLSVIFLPLSRVGRYPWNTSSVFPPLARTVALS